MTNNLDQAIATAEAFRKELAASAAAGAPLNQLAYEMVRVAEAEGALKVYRMVAVLDKNDTPVNERIEELTNMIAYGSNDNGSGRGNDIRRSEFDGVRQAVTRELGRMYRKLDRELNGN